MEILSFSGTLPPWMALEGACPDKEQEVIFARQCPEVCFSEFTRY